MLTPAEYGTKMANTLLRELTVLPAVKFQKSMDDLLDNVPTNGEFFSHQQNHKKIEPTKEALLQDMLQNKKSLVAFCCVSLQTDTRMTFDIDHVFPREKITEKQKLLLDYLNNPINNDVAQAFMGETAPHDAHKTDIGKYFKRDPKDGKKIKGTKWFFDVCYNSLNNLTHLKHYLNRGKSATSPKEWFDNHFPQRFKDDVRTSGGINEGIIMQQVFPIAGLDSINIGKDSHGANVVVYLHETTGVGLGEFIRQWFKTNADTIIVESKEIQEINAKLTDMLTEDLCDGEGEEELKKFISTINEVLNVAKVRETISRGSTPDSEGAEGERHVVAYNKIEEAFEYMHSVKSMKKLVLPLVVEGDRDLVDKNFYRYCREQKLYTFNYDEIAEATKLFIKTCEQKKSQGITNNEIQTFIQQALEAVDPRKRLEKAISESAAKDSKIADLERQLAAARTVQQSSVPQLPTSNALFIDTNKRPASDMPRPESSDRTKRPRPPSP